MTVNIAEEDDGFVGGAERGVGYGAGLWKGESVTEPNMGKAFSESILRLASCQFFDYKFRNTGMKIPRLNWK